MKILKRFIDATKNRNAHNYCTQLLNRYVRHLFQKFEPLDELKQASLIILLSNFSSQTTFELVKILKERTLASNIEYDEVLDVAHSRKPPIGALLWNRNDFKGSTCIHHLSVSVKMINCVMRNAY